jgi:hypothetical protein
MRTVVLRVQKDRDLPHMHIGIFLEHLPNTGGGFQQALSAVESWKRGTAKHDLVIFTPFEGRGNSC